MQRIISLLPGLLLFLVSCSPKTTQPMLVFHPVVPTVTDTVYILDPVGTVPTGAQNLGSIRIGNNSLFVEYDFEGMIGTVIEQAKSAGGNAIKITDYQLPSSGNAFHQIEAIIFYVPDYQPTEENRNYEFTRNVTMRNRADH